MQEKIIILDFGSQTTQLIGRRVRELNVYCEIVPYNKFPQGDASVKGVILSGSPFSVYDESAFKIDLNEIRGKYPILGICYGAQFIAYTNGGKVEPAGSREYGRAHLASFDKNNVLFKGVKENTQVWMSHGDTITAIPESFKTIASTDKVKIAAYQVEGEKMWGVQFHPEVFHSEDGTQMLKNFVVEVCGCRQDWSAASFIETTVAQLKEQLGDDKVVLGLSGGVDSSVAAVLLNRAIGKNLTCIFVDHGMLRKDEFKNVFTYGEFIPEYEEMDHIQAFYRKDAAKCILVAANFGTDVASIELKGDVKKVLLSNQKDETVNYTKKRLNLKSCEVVVLEMEME